MKRIPPPDREVIKSSAEFRAFVEEQQIEAQRRKDDRLKTIADKRMEISRAEDDHAAFVLQIMHEISDIQGQISDDDEILSAATAALSKPRPGPVLVPHSEVADAIEAQKP